MAKDSKQDITQGWFGEAYKRLLDAGRREKLLLDAKREMQRFGELAADLALLTLRGRKSTAVIGAVEIERPQGPQADRVLRALPELYPPHGVVTSGTSIETVRGKVAKELADESRQRGLADPGRDTVKRCIDYLRALHE
jgi:hypothetical protein